MRHRFTFLALAVTMIVSACADTPPTTSSLRSFAGAARLTLEETIQEQIDSYLPQGFEDAVGARWSTVKAKKNEGDLAGAEHQFITLSTWIVKKTGDIVPPEGASQTQAAASLITNMAAWLYGGEVQEFTQDVAIAAVPAGDPLLLQTPSFHAGLSWNSGSTNEDRIVVLAQDPNSYPGICNGPLDTPRCQYPLFYVAESFPKLKLNYPGKFAVCMVTTGDRRPLDYLEDEPDGPVHERMRLAHNKPANAADYTPGASQLGNIELLPLSGAQSGTLIDCDEPDVIGMNKVERALYAMSKLAAKFLSPKNAFAYDQGPEHDFSFFSNFNGVDPLSTPDIAVASLSVPATATGGSDVTVSYAVENRSRRSGGEATAASAPTTVAAWLSSDQTIDANDTPLGSAAVPGLLPDASFPVSHTFTAPASGSYYVLVKAEPNSGVTEVTLANNTASSAISFGEGGGNPTGFGTAVIDGAFGESEWANAQSFALTVNLPGGQTTTATLYVMNDNSHAYFALRFGRNGIDAGTNLLGFEIDANNNGQGPENGDDYFTYQSTPSDVFSDASRSTCGEIPAACVLSDAIADGAGAFSNSGGFSVYEMSHPLNSGNPGDMVTGVGQTIGLFMQVQVGGISTTWPGAFISYQPITLAGFVIP